LLTWLQPDLLFTIYFSGLAGPDNQYNNDNEGHGKHCRTSGEWGRDAMCL